MKLKSPQGKAHATFSASGSARWLACSASIALSEKAPLQTDSPFAKEGTDAHACLEAILKNPNNRFGTEARLRIAHPEDMVDYAARAADWIFERKSKAAGELLVETKVDAGPFTRPGEFGTLDAAIVSSFDTLHVIDFKYGAGVPVDPEDNTQMLYYALALSHKYEHNFESVELTIVQPRAEHSRGPIRTWSIPIDELLTWEAKFKAGVKAALKPNPAYAAGDHCRWCPAKSICPEISTKAFKEARIDFEPVTEDALTVATTKGLPATTIGKILGAADKIETYLAEIRSQAFIRLQGGEKIPGWKLVPKRASRKWTNAEKVEREAKKVFGDMAFDVSLKSPAQLEQLAADAKPWVAKRCASVSSGDTLAPESDPREASKGAAADFEAVVEEKPTKKRRK